MMPLKEYLEEIKSQVQLPIQLSKNTLSHIWNSINHHKVADSAVIDFPAAVPIIDSPIPE